MEAKSEYSASKSKSLITGYKALNAMAVGFLNVWTTPPIVNSQYWRYPSSNESVDGSSLGEIVYVATLAMMDMDVRDMTSLPFGS